MDKGNLNDKRPPAPFGPGGGARNSNRVNVEKPKHTKEALKGGLS